MTNQLARSSPDLHGLAANTARFRYQKSSLGLVGKKKGAGKVLGDGVYCLYDKRRQLIDAGLTPPHGDVDLTRIERRATRHHP